jgi:predicted flavoprotein YhiN
VSDRARDVRDALVGAARAAGVEIRFNVRVTGLAMEAGWRVETAGAPIEAAAVILASGGRSVPATGSDGALLEIVRGLGHTVHPTYPALTPLIADPPVHAGLSGISLPVRIRAKWQNRETEGAGRISVYASWLQRTIGTRRVSRGGAEPCGRQGTCGSARPLV